MNYVLEKAYAKINLYLDVETRRPDGYHDLLTIMQMVSICDDVWVELIPEDKIIVELTNTDINIPQEENLAYKAAKKFYEFLDFKPRHIGAKITITKRIPIAAGLGGGSADAAAVLRGLNFIYGKPYDKEQLIEIAMTLGSDVPFCLIGGVHTCQERGDKLSLDIYGIRHYNILIAKGDNKLSTADQYRKLDEKYNRFKDYRISENYSLTFNALSSHRCTEAFQYMRNIFETVYDENSNIEKIKTIMYEHSAKLAMLTGSGPSVFGVFPNMFYAEDAQEALKKENIDSIMCHPINIEYERIDPRINVWEQ